MAMRLLLSWRVKMWMQKVENRAKIRKEWIFKRMPRLLKLIKKVFNIH